MTAALLDGAPTHDPKRHEPRLSPPQAGILHIAGALATVLAAFAWMAAMFVLSFVTS